MCKSCEERLALHKIYTWPVAFFHPMNTKQEAQGGTVDTWVQWVLRSWIPFSDFKGEVENISANQRPGLSWFFNQTKNTNLVEDDEILDSVKFHWILFSSTGEKSKMSQPIKGWGSHLTFPIGPKSIKFLEDVEILLPVKFSWILFSSFRGEVQNVLANQRPGQPSCFSDCPKKNTILVEDVEILHPVEFGWILFCGFRGECESLIYARRRTDDTLW